MLDPLNEDQQHLLGEVWDVFTEYGRFPTYRYEEILAARPVPQPGA